MLCGIDNILRDILRNFYIHTEGGRIFHGIMSVPQNIVTDMNNVMLFNSQIVCVCVVPLPQLMELSGNLILIRCDNMYH